VFAIPLMYASDKTGPLPIPVLCLLHLSEETVTVLLLHKKFHLNHAGPVALLVRAILIDHQYFHTDNKMENETISQVMLYNFDSPSYTSGGILGFNNFLTPFALDSST